MNAISVLVSSLCIASVLSFETVPFQVRELTNTSIWTGLEGRIYNGKEAREGEFKFMIFALMKLPDGRISRCSASLISPNWVLLAAHCVNFKGLREKNIILVGGKAKLSDYVAERLRIGYDTAIDEPRFGVQERRAEKFFVHPKYDDAILCHDIALVKVKKPFEMDSVTTISLSKSEIKTEKKCTILGWGLTKEDSPSFNLNFAEDIKVITTRMGCIVKTEGPFICLKPDKSGICQGDSGSPLVCQDEVWGVASHFVSEETNPDCGNSIEEYYSELYPEIKWIEKTMRGTGYKTSATNLACLLLCVFFAVRSFDMM